MSQYFLTVPPTGSDPKRKIFGEGEQEEKEWTTYRSPSNRLPVPLVGRLGDWVEGSFHRLSLVSCKTYDQVPSFRAVTCTEAASKAYWTSRVVWGWY